MFDLTAADVKAKYNLLILMQILPYDMTLFHFWISSKSADSDFKNWLQIKMKAATSFLALASTWAFHQEFQNGKWPTWRAMQPKPKTLLDSKSISKSISFLFRDEIRMNFLYAIHTLFTRKVWFLFVSAGNDMKKYIKMKL